MDGTLIGERQCTIQHTQFLSFTHTLLLLILHDTKYHNKFDHSKRNNSMMFYSNVSVSHAHFFTFTNKF